MSNFSSASLYAAGQSVAALVRKVPFSAASVSDDGGVCIDLDPGELQRRLIGRNGRMPGEITQASRNKILNYAVALTAGDVAIGRGFFQGDASNDNTYACREVIALAAVIYPKRASGLAWLKAQGRWLEDVSDTATHLAVKYCDQIEAVARALGRCRSLTCVEIGRVMRERADLELC